MRYLQILVCNQEIKMKEVIINNNKYKLKYALYIKNALYTWEEVYDRLSINLSKT